MKLGFRFRKTIKLFPGVKLNLSKSGVSTSLGVPGATVNVKSGRKSKATVGIPGTGLSYSENVEASESSGSSLWVWVLIAVVAVAAYKVFL